MPLTRASAHRLAAPNRAESARCARSAPALGDMAASARNATIGRRRKPCDHPEHGARAGLVVVRCSEAPSIVSLSSAPSASAGDAVVGSQASPVPRPKSEMPLRYEPRGSDDSGDDAVCCSTRREAAFVLLASRAPSAAALSSVRCTAVAIFHTKTRPTASRV